MPTHLLRVANPIVKAVQSGLDKQLRIIEEQVHNPLRDIVQLVSGGVWVGAGANAFIEELTSLLIPGVGRVSDDVITVKDKMDNALTIMTDADEEANALLNSRLLDESRFC